MNISAVLYSNRPGFTACIQNKVLNCFSQVAASNIRYVESFVSNQLFWYSYLVGIGNRWIMFGYQNHYNWWYQIKAKYTDSETILLPLPRQSKRTFWQWLLFDLKEAKLIHNIYADEKARRAYSNYLCRQFSTYNNSPVDSVIWELQWQNILEPKYARENGTYLDPNISSEILNEFKCPGAEDTQ